MTLAEHPGADASRGATGGGVTQGATGGADRDAPPADSEWRRLSGRMLLVHPVRELVQNIPTLLVLLIAGHSRGGNGQWWSLAGVGAVIAASIARWFTTRYRITPEQVQLRKGLLRRQTITTPADRVRSVDVSASALHRVLGLAKVEIGTGVSDTKKESLALDGLSTAAANGLRAELLHRGRRGPGAPVRPAGVAGARLPEPDAGAVPVTLPPPVLSTSAALGDGSADDGIANDGIADDDPGVETEITRLRPRWIGFAPFTFSGILTALAVAGVGSRFLNEANLDLSRTAAYQEAAGRITSTPVWVALVAGLVVLVVAVALLSLLAYVLAFWGFRLTRHSRGTLDVRRGLITTRATSIEERRLRGVEVSEPLLLRAVRGARLIAITTGLRVGRGAQRGGSMIVPPAPRAEVGRVAAEILHLLPDEAPAGAAAVVDAAGDLVSGPLVAHGPAALLLAAPFLALDRYSSLGHAAADGYLVTRFGSLVRRRSILATDGIIGWNLDATWFQRRAGLVTLAATTAAGDQAYCVWDAPAADALQLARQATPGLLEQFLA